MHAHAENISNTLHICDKKVCSHCKILKPHSEFHLKGVDSSGNPRLQSSCKDCANTKRTTRYKKQKNKKPIKNSIKNKISDFKIEIIYATLPNQTHMKDVMSDFIEAVYALPS
jgi:hypothetical protein